MWSNSTTDPNIQIARFSTDEAAHEKVRGVLMSYQEIRPGIGCIGLTGRLDARNIPQIEQLFAFMTTVQKKPVIVDLGGVELMNSVGLGMLISNANALKAYEAPMILLNPQPRVERVIRIACVDPLLPIMYSMAEALRTLNPA